MREDARTNFAFAKSFERGKGDSQTTKKTGIPNNNR